MVRIKILEDSPDSEDKAGHLWPIIDFLIERGNVPLTGNFIFDTTGAGTFLFKDTVNVDLLNLHFDIPYSIRIGHDTYYGGGIVWDLRYALKIHRA